MILVFVLAGTACSTLAQLPLKLQSGQAPLAAQIKAHSYVPLSSEPRPRDVVDEEGAPILGTRFVVNIDLSKYMQ